MNSAAPVFTLLIPQYSDYRRTLRLRNKTTGELVDLSDYTIQLQVRESFRASTTLIDLSSDMPSDDGSIIIDGTAAEILIPAEVTASLDFEVGVYDIRFSDYDGEVFRVLQGAASLDRGVTR